jgi:hypothetical protein
MLFLSIPEDISGYQFSDIIFSRTLSFDINEIVQGPCAHMVLHDKIYVDFTDLLTVIEFTKR